MAVAHAKGPFCQSCGMPLAKPEDFGTSRGGSRAEDYCHFCYADGAFINPEMTLPEMTDICVGALERQGIPGAQARTLMARTLPLLTRWRAPVNGVTQAARG